MEATERSDPAEQRAQQELTRASRAEGFVDDDDRAQNASSAFISVPSISGMLS